MSQEQLKDKLKPRKKEYSHDMEAWDGGYNSAIDDMNKWIEDAPIQKLVHEIFIDEHILNNNCCNKSENVAIAIRKLLKGGQE